METKHTKGKWAVSKNLSFMEVNCSNMVKGIKMAVSVHLFQDGLSLSLNEESEANAKLIAAAPELLEALIEAKEHLIKYIKRLYEETDCGEEMANELASQEVEKMLLGKAIKKATE